MPYAYLKFKKPCRYNTAMHFFQDAAGRKLFLPEWHVTCDTAVLTGGDKSAPTTRYLTPHITTVVGVHYFFTNLKRLFRNKEGVGEGFTVEWRKS